MLLSKTKPISIAIVYKPPADNNFLDYVSKGLNDFNLIKMISLENFGAAPKKYAQICSTLGLKHFIKHPTRITCHVSTLIDHILTNCELKVTQSGVIDTLLSSDHQVTFCTRKIERVKTNNHKQISILSLENYSMEKWTRVKKYCDPKLWKV